jgi:hypothetical protein
MTPQVSPSDHMQNRHVQVDGSQFPFSRGVSFYTVNDQGQITSGRDCVEPAIKPGSTALLVAAAP